MKDSNFISSAISHVKEEGLHHFIEMQRNVWNPGMKHASGLIGGEFAISLKNKLHFLVLTGWGNQKTYQNYMVNVFSDLKKVAIPEQDIVNLEGEQFIVENSWRVYPNSN